MRWGKRFWHNQLTFRERPPYGGLSLKVNLPKREPDYSPSSNVEVQTDWSYTIPFQYATSSHVHGQLDLYHTMNIYGVVEVYSFMNF